MEFLKIRNQQMRPRTSRQAEKFQKRKSPVVDLTQFLWWLSEMPLVIPALNRGRGGSSGRSQ
jgi:hypothetical protein